MRPKTGATCTSTKPTTEGRVNRRRAVGGSPPLRPTHKALPPGFRASSQPAPRQPSGSSSGCLSRACGRIRRTRRPDAPAPLLRDACYPDRRRSLPSSERIVEHRLVHVRGLVQQITGILSTCADGLGIGVCRRVLDPTRARNDSAITQPEAYAAVAATRQLLGKALAAEIEHHVRLDTQDASITRDRRRE